MLVFPGRFQPFHNGHDEVVRDILGTNGEQELVLAVVVGVNLNGVPGDAFDAESAEHFLPDRNPFSPLAVHSMLQQLAWTRYEGRPGVVMIPRPSRGTAWQVMESMLPGPRTWVVPAAGETWDERKAEFFVEMNDEVLRVPHSPDVSGMSLRAAMAADRWDEVARGVPPGLAPLLRNAFAP